MPTEYLAFECDTNKFWVARLSRRIHESPSSTLQGRVAQWQNSPLYEMGLAVNTKLAMLDEVVARINRRLHDLDEETSDDQRVKNCLQTHSAYSIRNKSRFFKTLVDIDSFLFESRSAYEIVGRFLCQFFRDILERPLTEAELKQSMSSRGIDTRWIEELREDRKLFFHETAPWVSVRVVSQVPLRFELIILKKNVQEPGDSDDYIEFQRVREIYQGFRSSMPTLYQWIGDQIQDFESTEKPGANSG